MTSTSLYYIQMKQGPKTQGCIKILLRDGSGYRIQHINIININYGFKLEDFSSLITGASENAIFFLEESTPIFLCKGMK